MQPRLVDLLRPALMPAIRGHPNNTRLPIVEKLVTALESRSRSASTSPRQLFPEAEAVLRIQTSPGQMGSPGNDFWRTLILVVAFTEGKRWFKRFFDWFEWLENEKAEDKRWSFVHSYVAAYHRDDELSPADAAQNITDWLAFARILIELRDDSPRPRPDVLAQMHRTYVETLHGLLLHIQALLDRSLAQVASANPPQALRELVALIGEIQQLPKEDMEIELEETSFDKPDKERFFIDSFPIFTRRRFEALHYDRKNDNPFVERITTFGGALTRRLLQAGLLAELYGHPRKGGDQPSAADQLRAHTMQRIQKPASIDGHDQFVRLLEAIFIEQRDEAKRLGKNDMEGLLKGWEASVGVIEDVLDHFTAHSGYDLSDKGPNYLATAFPRTLAGERLHDCGVYAAHIASWLLHLERSLNLRHKVKLGLDLRFVALPLHVGLIVRLHLPGFPPDPDGLPIGGALITHNARLHRMDLAALKTAKTEWGTLPADPDPTDAEQRLRKLFEDIAASHYISAVDMPVSSKRVLGTGVTLTTNAVWNSYFDFAKPNKNIFAKPVTEGPGDLFQFYLTYLELLMGRSAFYNETMLEGLWRKDARDLFRKLLLLSPDTNEPDKSAFPVPEYIAQMQALLQAYLKKIQDFEQAEQSKRDAITASFDTRGKDIVSSAARRVFSIRRPIPTMSDVRRPIDDISNHLDLCRAFLTSPRRGGVADRPPTPPFEMFGIPNRLI